MAKHGGRTKSARTVRNVRAVAYLSAAGQDTRHIADRLAISHPRVAQLRAEAEAEGLLAVPKPVLGPKWTDELTGEMNQFLGGEFIPELNDLLAKAHAAGLLVKPLQAHVFPGKGPERSWDERLEHFGELAAPFLGGLLMSAESAGVSWGATLDAVVRGIERSTLLPRAAGKIVPICGEPLGRLPKEYSATELAARIATRLAGSRHNWRSLAAVPFLIPLNFTAAERRAVFKLAGKVNGYGEIFGGGRLADRLDMVLTSVGLAGLPFGQNGRRFLEESGFDAARMKLLNASVVADISGVLLPRDPVGPDAAKLLGEIDRSWTGISLRQLAACARRARRSGRGGVVVAAIGQSKAAVVLECMMREGGLISHLVIDDDLEEELRRLIRALLDHAPQRGSNTRSTTSV